MKKLLFILLLFPLFAFPQAEKRYRSIIIDSVKALNGSRVDVKDTLLLDSLAVYNTDLSPQYTSRSLVDSAFVGTAISASGGNTIYSADDNLAGNRTVTMGANSLTFDGNLTTFKGINAASSSFVGLFTDNVDADILRIENDGHVGINITNPSQQMHVLSNGGINDGAGIRFENAVGDFFEFGGDGPTSSGNPLLRSQNTGLNGVGAFFVHEIAPDNDILGAPDEFGILTYQIQRIGGGQITNSRLLVVSNATSARFMIMPDGDMLFYTLGGGFLGTNVPDTEIDFRMGEADVWGVRNGEVVGNDATLNSPTMRLSGPYDSDPGGGTTSTDFKSEIRTFVTTAGASPTGRLALSVEGNEGLSIDQNGIVSINGILYDQTSTTLGAAATTVAVTSTGLTLTGDGGGNTLATITGFSAGGELTIIFTDGNVTITDDNSHAANSVDLSAAFTGADDTTLKLRFDGTSWYEISRSTN